jgi:hypothetical protein
MITYWLLLFVAGVLLGATSPLRILPDAALPAVVNSAITNISGFLSLVWVFFPLTFTALVGAIVIIVVTENWIFIYKIIRWTYRKIPGVS